MVIKFEAKLSGSGHSLTVEGFSRDLVISPQSRHGFVFKDRYLFEFEAVETFIKLTVRKNSFNLDGVGIFNSTGDIYEIGRSGVWEFDGGGRWEWLRPLS